MKAPEVLLLLFFVGVIDGSNDCNYALSELQEVVTRMNEELNTATRTINQLTSDVTNLKKGPSYCSCYWTSYVSDYDVQFEWYMEDWVITGMESRHDNKKNDRRFKFRICQLCYKI